MEPVDCVSKLGEEEGEGGAGSGVGEADWRVGDEGASEGSEAKYSRVAVDFLGVSFGGMVVKIGYQDYCTVVETWLEGADMEMIYGITLMAFAAFFCVLLAREREVSNGAARDGKNCAGVEADYFYLG